MQRQRATTETAERRNVTLPPIVSRAADALARREGFKFSQFIQELIRDRAAQTFGPDWPQHVDEEAA